MDIPKLTTYKHVYSHYENWTIAEESPWGIIRELRERGEVDLRDTSKLRVKHLTSPAAQMLEWTRAHSTTQQ